MDRYTVYYKVPPSPRERWALLTAASKDDARKQLDELLKGKGEVTRVVAGWDKAGEERS